MGIKNAIRKIGDKAGNRVARFSQLSSEQVAAIQEIREQYMTQMPNPSDEMARNITNRMLAASSIEIFNSYLSQLKETYIPVEKDMEYEDKFDSLSNIRYFNITKWVTDKKENNIEKLVNVYAVLSNENCNIALVFNRTQEKTNVYLAVVNLNNAKSSTDAEIYKSRIIEAIRGNFPGAEIKENDLENKGFGYGIIPCFKDDKVYSVASASNIPTEKSEKFISQTIEKLLDGIVPDTKQKEYTLILLATPIDNIEERKLKLAEFHSGLTPYASWSTNFQLNENNSQSSSATVGVNIGASAGVQNSRNNTITDGDANTENESNTVTESENETNTDSLSDTESSSEAHMEGENSSHMEQNGTSVSNVSGESVSDSSSNTTTVSGNVNAGFGPFGGSAGTADARGTSHATTTSHSTANTTSKSVADTLGKMASDTITKGMSKTVSHSLAKSTGTSVANTLGKAVTKSIANSNGKTKAINYGVNAGASFARSSTITTIIGKGEGITQNFENFHIKHTLELLEKQMSRLEQSSALGMWDFAAYVLSEDHVIANNVAHTYSALTLGEESYVSNSSINLWRGGVPEEKDETALICDYLRELRHPVFGLRPDALLEDLAYLVYPPMVTATTSLSGKELAYSLNFPQKSITGLPVIECVEFGRNITSYEAMETDNTINVGNIFHMNHEEATKVSLELNSLASHTFVTGSTGSGKSNTVYKIIDEARKKNVRFMVIEPAKGEYKNVYGNLDDVNVFCTNNDIAPLLKINPFSFPDGIHVFEHMDRLVELFNVCWPMYAAMPAVLKNAVQKSYEDCGWDVITSMNKYGKGMFPCFADVARNVRIIIDSSDYDAENKGAYKGSLLTRLESLTTGINSMIFSDDEIDNKDLFDSNVIVDLSRVGSNETKSLLMGMLILKMQEYRLSSAISMNQPLKHITVLEEAHNILKRISSEVSSEGANLLGKSVEMISNAIAEMRTYGEGFVIVDQAPGLLDMASIRNTNTKIIMRLPDQADRELVGKAANLNDDQITELARLPKGVAAVYQNEWILPVLCKVSKKETPSTKYVNQHVYFEEQSIDAKKTLHIMELLSDCISIDKEMFNMEIVPELNSLPLRSSVKVMIIKMLLNPMSRPKMTKIAPVVNEFFPSVVKAVKDTYSYSSNTASDWTQAAMEALKEFDDYVIKDQVRRDIIQGAITYYFLNESNNVKALQEWKERGNLR